MQPLFSDGEIASAWPVVSELRPHLDREALIAACKLQRAEGFLAAGLFIDERCVAFAGYRIQTMLAHGRFLYVDDLVVTESLRGGGAGEQLLEWLLVAARAAGCVSLQLDSGTQRTGAHAFYFRRGLKISSFHFIRPLAP
ncbi:MAG: GNAT family N-acetyltransferase [Pseudomarimonas sp.]